MGTANVANEREWKRIRFEALAFHSRKRAFASFAVPSQFFRADRIRGRLEEMDDL